ncbi:MAG: PH domain-containing protein [Acidimicrobiales bacterium]
MSSPAAAPAEGGPLDWRRPHPITLLVEAGAALRQVVVAIVLVSGNVVNGLVIEMTLIFLPLGGAVARWYTTRYALDAESIHHHYGLIWRRRQVLPRSNVQNVSTKAGIIARMASVVELQVSDASSDGDIDIRFVSQAEADRLTTLLRDSMTPGSGGDGDGDGDGDKGAVTIGDDGTATTSAGRPAPVGPPIERPPLAAPSTGRLVATEASSLTVAVTALSAVLAGIGSLVGSGLVDGPPGGRRWLIVAVATAAPLLVALTAVVGRVLALGAFRLTADPDRLRIRVGLLTEARVATRRERLQQLRVRRELIHRRLGIERVEFETADVDVKGAGTSYLDPAAAAGSWRSLAVATLGSLELDEDDLRPVSPHTIRRTLVRTIPAVLVWLALAPVALWLPPAPMAATAAVGWWYARARYRRLGWALGADQLLVRNGVVVETLSLVELDKVQSLRLHSTLFQRRWGLSTLQLSTAGLGLGGLVQLPDLSTATAEALVDALAHRAAATPLDRTL